MAARGSSFGAKIFVFCRSGHGGSPGIVRFLKFRTYLHRSEGGGRDLSKDFGSAWRHVRPFLGLKFSGFVDRSPFNSPVVLVF